ncbi:MAG: GAP family protein [Actinobacteria bacterium]|nr:GAP family protein [Actinomycetota bacterium]
MTEMWIELLPVLLAMMISPARTLAVIVLLHTPRSTTTALGYVGGMASAMLLQGAGLGAAMSLVGLTSDERSGDLAIFVGALFVVGGIILLAGALKIATAPTSGGGSLASVLDRLEHTEPAGAYKVGFGWLFASPKQWVFVLTAVAVIFAAELRPVGSLGNYAVFTLLVQAAYFVIIGAYAIAKVRVGRLLDTVFGWLRGHLRPTAIGLFVFFGIVFLIKGFSALN